MTSVDLGEDMVMDQEQEINDFIKKIKDKKYSENMVRGRLEGQERDHD